MSQGAPRRLASLEFYEREEADRLIKDCGEGPDAHAHHQSGTIFDMARLFLEMMTADQTHQAEGWLAAAIADALEAERARAAHNQRNYQRAQARKAARMRQRSAGSLAALSAESSRPETTVGSVASVTPDGSRADRIWDTIRSSVAER